ncbi:hypothetical protein D5086_003767 [Populus alba]|uniref:Uncharacterized protein n=1 Tax=Populus alba TaxID=43335 RepID=A0ACC4D7E1_POPAL
MWCDSIEELPDEIGELKELRLLDVTGCELLRRIPVNLIARLKKLEELLIGDESFKGWDVVGCDSTEGMNASLTELSSLSHLAVLSLKIPKVSQVAEDSRTGFFVPTTTCRMWTRNNGWGEKEDEDEEAEEWEDEDEDEDEEAEEWEVEEEDEDEEAEEWEVEEEEEEDEDGGGHDD